MTQLSGPISAGLEPIPGYILRRRLGAGGYGEVWLADAPGGLQKAIKLVYGTVDQERASSELRSLQRIRQVHHPFLLSLERIELVNHQIVIVTELAECSLVERFLQFRGKGLPGIPRELLIDLLRDAADALDFLSQKHDLQHLDVKPGNLLIVADRIKVADFGLVKDLQEQNQSLVGGLTPTYAAPEIFDGRPDRRSDQYSLAIVYQELLTGQMPFNGRSTAELARQHLNQAPNLDSLPPADRPVIARALAKNPLNRFSSCRQLIDQLSRVRAVVAMMPNSDETEKVTKEPSTAASVPSTSTSLGGRQRVLPPLEVAGTLNSWVPPRCLYIGLGGVGCKALQELYATMKNDEDAVRDLNDHEWLAIDSDSESLDAVSSSTAMGVGLPSAAAVQTQLFRPQEYRAAHPQLFRAISRRWLYNIPRSLKTEGVRPLGLLAFLDHYDQLSRTLYAKLAELVKRSSEDQYRSSEPLRIYVISSLHGGTGGAIFIEIGYLIRDIFRQLNWHNYRVCGNLTAATTLAANHSEMATSAAIACCSELTHCMDSGSIIPPLHYANTQSIDNPQKPFDWVNLFDGGVYASQSDEVAVHKLMAEALWLDSQTMAGSTLSSARLENTSSKLSWLRTLQTARLRHATTVNAASLSRVCCAESLRKAIAFILGPKALLNLDSAVAARSSATCSGEMPLTANATDDILRRVLVELRFQFEDTLTEDVLLSAWVRRLSDESEEVEAQFADDLRTLQSWLNGLVHARILNLKQLEKLQLVLIERIMDHANVNCSPLVEYLAQFEFPGTTSEAAARTRAYLKRLALAAMNLLQQFQKCGHDLGERLQSWSDSMAAEASLTNGQELPCFDSLAGEWAQVAARVVAVLESTFHRLTIQILESTLGGGCAPASDADAVNLQYLITLSRDLCDRFARDFRIPPEQAAVGAVQDEKKVNGILFNQLQDFLPALSQFGGDVHRLIVVPQDQLQFVADSVNKCGLSESTTLVPSSIASQAYIFTDAANLNFSRLVGALWRPSHKTFQLAERLLTRVDIEWPNAGNLLSIDEKVQAHSAPLPSVPLSEGVDLQGTQQIDLV
jgi:serine/threonine protein kinase